YMFENNNKTTGDYLSVIPEFTINSGLRWQATDSLSMQSTLTWYGRQKPKKINYKGNPTTGTETNEISPYSILGISAKYAITKNLSVTAGVDNIFDKRLFRAGNSLHAFNPITGEITMYGAGAETYNEPGRTYYFSVNTHF
ncbi:TonB-dependent receptor, partial [Escherichia coli]|nr:TonB-dependent receptor [Escherichia coli]